jgi:Tfp pilus assembly protein PilF
MFWEQDASNRLHLRLVGIGKEPARAQMAAEEARPPFGGEPEEPPVSAEEASRELERVLTDPKFRSSERNKRFLRYVTEKLLEGEGDKIKAYSVAVDVFGRPEDFDPLIDPIVRIEAMRLRASLAHYYEVHGQGNLLRIDLPKGGYVPVISRRSPPEGVTQATVDAPAVADGPDTKSGNGQSPQGSKLFWGLSTGLVVSGLALAGFALSQFMTSGNGAISEKPRTFLNVSVAGDQSAQSARDFKEALLVAVSQFQTVRIVNKPEDQVLAGNAQMVPSPPGAFEPAYQIDVDYRPHLPQPSLWWQVIDRDHGEVLISRVEPVPEEAEDQELMVARLANRLAGLRGTISNTELRRDYAAPTLGYGCVLRAYRALHASDPAMLQTARSCLEKTIKARPGDAAAHAALSRVLPVLDPLQPSQEVARRALSLANTATVLAPGAAAGVRAQMEALFHLGHTDAAIRAGRRAIVLNPSDHETIAAFAGVLAATGQWDEAMSMVEKALDLAGAASPEVHAALAMDAYRRGAYGEALAHLEQGRPAFCCEAGILRLATLGQLGMFSAAGTTAALLQGSGLGSQTKVRSYMTGRHFDPAFVSLLQDGVSKAGLPLQ